MTDLLVAVVVFVASLITSMFSFNYNDQKSYNVSIKQKREMREPIYNYNGTEPYLINTPGCYIPNYGKKLVFKEAANKNISCKQRAIFVRKILKWRETKLIFRIDKDKMRHYVLKKQKYECCYSFAFRSNVTGYEDRQISYTKCKTFKSGSMARLIKEVILIKCFNITIQRNKTIRKIFYEDAYTFVKKQPRKSINKKIYEEESWNVLLLGIDTMSRARILSAMPRLVKYMQAQGWLDYKGYQKIGYNTYPNFMAVFTGKKMSTIDQSCSSGMHNCNHLMAWSTFRKSGYITAYGEDNLKMPDTFFTRGGFKTPPTHHYMRPFFLTGESQQGNIICTKSKPSAKHIIDYAYDFANTYKTDKFFGTFWINSLSHNVDYLPSIHENITLNFLKNLEKSGILKKTFIIFLSDHGIRNGPTRLQFESFYAERLPMLYIWVPIKFRKMYEDEYYNLQVNQNNLVTPYDMYLTLIKISNMSRSSANIKSEACPLCRDLFTEQSPSRTCADAGVIEKWCSCHEMIDANNLTNTDAFNSVQLVVSFIQNYTLYVKTTACTTCYPLRLNRIFRIHTYINQKNKRNYVIAFQMVADRNDFKKTYYEVSYEAIVLNEKKKLTIVGSISPISSYSSRSYCVKNRGDHGFCICKKIKCR